MFVIYYNLQYTHTTIGCRFWTLSNNEQKKNWMIWWEMGEFKSCVYLHRTNMCIVWYLNGSQLLACVKTLIFISNEHTYIMGKSIGDGITLKVHYPISEKETILNWKRVLLYHFKLLLSILPYIYRQWNMNMLISSHHITPVILRLCFNLV